MALGPWFLIHASQAFILGGGGGRRGRVERGWDGTWGKNQKEVEDLTAAVPPSKLGPLALRF